MNHHLYCGDRNALHRHARQQKRALVRSPLLMAVVVGAGFARPASAADRFYLLASPTAEQTTRYEQGVAKIFDNGSAALVRVTEVTAPEGRIALEVAVLNKIRASINLSPEDVQISTTDGRSLPIISYEQLTQKEESRQKGQRFWSRLAAAGRIMSTANAGYQQGSGIFTTNTNGSIGGTPYSGQTSGIYSYSSSNPAVAAAAQREAAATNIMQADALAARQARNMAAYDVVLRATTVDPGATAGGTVQFEVPKELRRAQAPVWLQMTVTVNSETHRFLGQLQKNGN